MAHLPADRLMKQDIALVPPLLSLLGLARVKPHAHDADEDLFQGEIFTQAFSPLMGAETCNFVAWHSNEPLKQRHEL
jgi:hypothetical protein